MTRRTASTKEKEFGETKGTWTSHLEVNDCREEQNKKSRVFFLNGVIVCLSKHAATDAHAATVATDTGIRRHTLFTYSRTKFAYQNPGLKGQLKSGFWANAKAVPYHREIFKIDGFKILGQAAYSLVEYNFERLLHRSLEIK